jgi:hypothetical protein
MFSTAKLPQVSFKAPQCTKSVFSCCGGNSNVTSIYGEFILILTEFEVTELYKASIAYPCRSSSLNQKILSAFLFLVRGHRRAQKIGLGWSLAHSTISRTAGPGRLRPCARPRAVLRVAGGCGCPPPEKRVPRYNLRTNVEIMNAKSCILEQSDRAIMWYLIMVQVNDSPARNI